MTRIAVLGAGGVGGLVAAALARDGEAEVTVLARAETVAAIERDGITVESVVLGNFTARPRAVERMSREVEVLVVATKAMTLRAAIERMDAPPGFVVPLLNGLDHVALLRERFGERAVAGTIRVESDRPEPGRIVQTSPFLRVELASDTPDVAARLEPFAELLSRSGIPTTVGSSEAQVLWSKLARLNALACTTSAIDRPIGFIREDPEWRATLEAAIRETVAVGRAEGADLDAGQVIAELVEEAHPTLGSSMQRDIAAGREPELDAIPGAVLRAAARHRIACPTIERLVATIRERVLTLSA